MRGGRWTEGRYVVEAIIWRFQARSPCRDLRECSPAWQTVWWRLTAGARTGPGTGVLTALRGQSQAATELEWVVSVDSTIAREHQHAAGAPRVLREHNRISRIPGPSLSITLWVTGWVRARATLVCGVPGRSARSARRCGGSRPCRCPTVP